MAPATPLEAESRQGKECDHIAAAVNVERSRHDDCLLTDDVPTTSTNDHPIVRIGTGDGEEDAGFDMDTVDGHSGQQTCGRVNDLRPAGVYDTDGIWQDLVHSMELKIADDDKQAEHHRAMLDMFVSRANSRRAVVRDIKQMRFAAPGQPSDDRASTDTRERTPQMASGLSSQARRQSQQAINDYDVLIEEAEDYTDEELEIFL